MYRNVLRPFAFIVASFAFPAFTQQVPSASQADRIVVIKSTHTMTLYAAGKVLKVYHVSLGRGPADAKQKQGDNRTPEGSYTITARNPHSSCHLSLRISYPNAADRERAHELGVNPGGDIMVHGMPPGYESVPAGQQFADWTYGCIALTNPEMDEVWKLVPVGTPIEIRH